MGPENGHGGSTAHLGALNHNPNQMIGQHKVSVRDTVNMLQEQSRRNGGGYATNQFSSMDVRTASEAREANSKDYINQKGKGHGGGMDESDEERGDDDTGSEDGRAAKTQGYRQGDAVAANAEYA